MDPRALAITATVFSAISVLFAVIAAGGASPDVPWTVAKALNIKEKYGLLEKDTGGVTIRYSEIGTELGDVCDSTGKAALSFVIIGLLGALAATVMDIVRLLRSFNKTIILAAHGVLGLVLIIAWSTWIGGCHTKVRDAGGSVEPSSGFALSFLASAFQVGAFFLTYASPDFAPASARA